MKGKSEQIFLKKSFLWGFILNRVHRNEFNCNRSLTTNQTDYKYTKTLNTFKWSRWTLVNTEAYSRRCASPGGAARFNHWNRPQLWEELEETQTSRVQPEALFQHNAVLRDFPQNATSFCGRRRRFSLLHVYQWPGASFPDALTCLRLVGRYSTWLISHSEHSRDSILYTFWSSGGSRDPCEVGVRPPSILTAPSYLMFTALRTHLILHKGKLTESFF